MIKLPFYEDSYFCLHNFAAYQISFKGEVYPTAEHAYQAQKFENDNIAKEVREARTPLEANQIARKYKEQRRKDWSEVKVQVLYEILKEKVEQFPEVKKCLLDTGEEEIAEISPNDFWGNGSDGNGQNQCGKILMRIRSELK